MINITNENQCCGCQACTVVCPQQCIHMEKGTLGSKIAVANIVQCIDCGLCNKVCPMENKTNAVIENQKAYAALAIDGAVREQGSSGGVFETLARKVISSDGVVYGAAFDENLQLHCTAATTIDELKALCKSKYLQSDMLAAFSNVKADLDLGKQVLFVSTPCQVSALKLYLKSNYDNLITVDFFCHGVPSQEFFDECIAYEDVKNNLHTISYTFRTKVKNGSTPHYFTKTVEQNGNMLTKTDYYFKSLFYTAFQQYVTLRESCYACPYATRYRNSDITIGDFHDIDRYIKGINRFDGVSTVVLNTEKGTDLFKKVLDKLQIFDVDIEQLITDKTIFSGATPRPKHRDDFVKCYEEKGILGLEEKYLSAKYYRKNQLYYDMPIGIRKLLKKIIK